MNLIIWILLGLFVAIDLLVVRFIPTTSTGFLGMVRTFFLNVNAKVIALLDSIWGEVVKNWHEYAILGVIYFLLFGLGSIQIAVYVLIGYLLLRLIQDIFKV